MCGRMPRLVMICLRLSGWAGLRRGALVRCRMADSGLSYAARRVRKAGAVGLCIVHRHMGIFFFWSRFWCDAERLCGGEGGVIGGALPEKMGGRRGALERMILLVDAKDARRWKLIVSR